MNNTAKKEKPIVKDLAREPKVKNKNAPRKITHTITIAPTNYLNALWPDVEKQLERAVVRSNGRWTMEVLFHVIASNCQKRFLEVAWSR